MTEGALLYMELAEMGSGVAAINLALILERNDIFSTDRGLLGTLGFKSLSSEFNINKQLAMKYL
jgi:hypothetical protein